MLYFCTFNQLYICVDIFKEPTKVQKHEDNCYPHQDQRCRVCRERWHLLLSCPDPTSLRSSHSQMHCCSWTVVHSNSLQCSALDYKAVLWKHKWSLHGSVVRFFTLSLCLWGPLLEAEPRARFLLFCQQKRVIGADPKYRMSPTKCRKIQEERTNALIILHLHHRLVMKPMLCAGLSFFKATSLSWWRMPWILGICFIWSMDLSPPKNFPKRSKCFHVGAA